MLFVCLHGVFGGIMAELALNYMHLNIEFFKCKRSTARNNIFYLTNHCIGMDNSRGVDRT